MTTSLTPAPSTAAYRIPIIEGTDADTSGRDRIVGGVIGSQHLAGETRWFLEPNLPGLEPIFAAEMRTARAAFWRLLPLPARAPYQFTKPCRSDRRANITNAIGASGAILVAQYLPADAGSGGWQQQVYGLTQIDRETLTAVIVPFGTCPGLSFGLSEIEPPASRGSRDAGQRERAARIAEVVGYVPSSTAGLDVREPTVSPTRQVTDEGDTLRRVTVSAASVTVASYYDNAAVWQTAPRWAQQRYPAAATVTARTRHASAQVAAAYAELEAAREPQPVRAQRAG